MRLTKSAFNSNVVTAIASQISHASMRNKAEIYKHLTIVQAYAHFTLTIERIVFQDHTRGYKKADAIQVTLDIVAYTRINAANGMPENIPSQKISRRVKDLDAVKRFVFEYVNLINEKMGK